MLFISYKTSLFRDMLVCGVFYFMVPIVLIRNYQLEFAFNEKIFLRLVAALFQTSFCSRIIDYRLIRSIRSTRN